MLDLALDVVPEGLTTARDETQRALAVRALVDLSCELSGLLDGDPCRSSGCVRRAAARRVEAQGPDARAEPA